MLNQECKHCHKKWHQDSAKYCSWCGNKLVGEPEFKVGDYVTVYVNEKEKIAKIDELTENNSKAHGLWYDQTKVNVKQDFWFISKVSKCRYATSTEILEYEMALAFRKHGRKPFEVKRGDVVYLKGYDKNIFLDSGNIYKKHNFIDGDVGLVKTVEEVNEWLGISDE